MVDLKKCVVSAVPRIAQLKSEKLIEELHLPNLIVATKEEEGGYRLIEGIPTLEHAKLKARVEVLQRNQCQFMGKDIQSLSMKDLQNLEQQLDSAVKHVRSRKVMMPEHHHASISSDSPSNEKDVADYEEIN